MGASTIVPILANGCYFEKGTAAGPLAIERQNSPMMRFERERHIRKDALY